MEDRITVRPVEITANLIIERNRCELLEPTIEWAEPKWDWSQ